MNYKKVAAIAYVTVYSILSFLIWVYKRWITNGSMETMPSYMIIVYGVLMSVIALRIGFIAIMESEESLSLRGYKLTKVSAILLLVLALYYGFAMSGWYALFAYSLSITGIIKVFLVSLWCYPQLLIYIYIIQWVKEKVIASREREKKPDNHMWYKLFIIAFLIWNLLYVGFWPGGLPYDANLEIDTAMGNVPFSSWQPYIHVYIVRFALFLGNHISMFFMMQIAFEAALLAGFLCYLHKNHHISRKLIFISFILLILYMPIFSLGMELLRDSIFSLGYSWMVFLLIIYMDGKSGNVKLYYLQLFVSFFIVSTMRSNGIIVLSILAPSLIVYGVKRKNKKLCLVSTIVLVLWICINGPFAKLAKVEKVLNNNFAVESAIDDMRAVKQFGGTLPEGADEYLESIKIDSVEHWYDNYSDWTWARTYDMTNASTFKVVKYYIGTFFKNPYYVIKNRLTKSSIIWEIFGHGERIATNYISVNTRDDYYFYPREEGLMTSTAVALKMFTESLYADAFTLRSGLPIVLILLLLIYSKNRGNYTFVVPPTALNILALIYSLNYHERRYIYWIVMCAGVMYAYEIFTASSDRKEIG